MRHRQHRLIFAAAFAALALVAGCGGEADETAAPTTTRAATTAAPPPAPLPETEPANGLTAEEATWLADGDIDKSLTDIEKDYAKLERTGQLELAGDIAAIGSIGGGPGECRQALDNAGKPPTKRLEAVNDLTRRACVQAERALNQALTYTLYDEKTGQSTVHEGDLGAASASLKRANKLAVKARKALTKLEG